MKQVGTFPTPYGVTVPVYEGNDPNDPEAVTFTAESAAIFGGIHSPSRRADFVRMIREVGHLDLERLPEYGGRIVPRIAIAKPKSPIYPTIPKGMEMDIPVEAFVTLMMDRHRWVDRVEALLPAVESNLAQAEEWSSGPFPMPSIMGLAMSLVVTGALEHLHEVEIDCIEAAAVYALSEHGDWRRAGLDWLEPIRSNWFRDWRDARPTYRRWAIARISEGTALPSWLAYEEGARHG